MPPSDAASQYPSPLLVAAMPTIGLLSLVDPVDPRKAASPKLKMPPSAATSQYPAPGGVAEVKGPAVGSAEPVPGAGGRGRHADDRRVERLAAHRAEEGGVTQSEH